MSPRLLIAALALSLPMTASAQPSRDGELHAFLQERFADERASYPDTRYAHGWADLDADGRPEALVMLMSGGHCGSGGCDLYIYTPEQGSWYQHGSLSVTNAPVIVLNSRTAGWRDLAVRVAGGGARAHMALVPHAPRGQYGYHDNPTVPPARALAGTPRGRVVIGANDRGRRLF